MELYRFGVGVSVIEPGNYNSELARSAAARRGELTDAQKASPYAEFYASQLEETGDRSHFKEPDEVADAALHALFDDNPKLRYMVVPNREEAGWTISKMIRETVQLNEGQPHAFSRDEIIEMLDAAMGVTADE